jgi:hypothetical protein
MARLGTACEFKIGRGNSGGRAPAKRLSRRWRRFALTLLTLASLGIVATAPSPIDLSLRAHAQPALAQPALAQPVVAQPAGVDVDEARRQADQARFEGQAACKRLPELHGAWIVNQREDAATPGRWLADVIVDKSAAARQRAQLATLLGSRLKIERETRVPLQSLVAALRVRLRERFGREGHFLQGAFIQETEAGVLQLTLYGRVPEAGLNEVAVSECSSLMDADPAWNGPVAGEKLLLPDGRAMLGPAWDKTTESLGKQLYADLANESGLRGAWVELAECRDHLERFLNYDVYVWTDGQRSSALNTAVDAALKRLVSRPYEVVQRKPVPLGRLLDGVNLVLEAHARFDGCRVDDAHFEPQQGSLSGAIVVLRGRVTRTEMIDQIAGQIASPALRDDATWQAGAGQFFVERPDLQVIEPIAFRGVRFFEQGFEQYGRGEYLAAAESFRNAALDAPRTLEYRYWRVLALLQGGRRAEAFDHMLALVYHRPMPELDRTTVRSLESVQGAARMELIELRRQAESRYYLDRRLRAPARPANPTT